jgi:diguanylate cyclase (GGDEF)-like protein
MIQSTQIDELTGLLTRKGFLEAFGETLAKAKQKPQELPLSLVMMDIDHFLRINEEYGHVGGDNVLQATARVIQEIAGEQAIIGRYGGDEFNILFSGAEREDALLKMEHIRSAVSQLEAITADGKLVRGLTISGGIASFPIDGRSENELLRKADHALYRAKVAGRNQVRLAYEERMVPKTAHFTQTQLERLSKLAEEHGVSEADLLREAVDDLLTKYGVNDIES